MPFPMQRGKMIIFTEKYQRTFLINFGARKTFVRLYINKKDLISHSKGVKNNEDCIGSKS